MTGVARFWRSTLGRAHGCFRLGRYALANVYALAETRGFKTDVIDEMAGDEAGIKSVTLTVDGEYATATCAPSAAFTGCAALAVRCGA